ncbi:hypothetical protein [Atlanticothrix silvestris]|nr:hypothetical protein [Atlanticothrix silvestris]
MMSNFFTELSTEQQELLTGGQCYGRRKQGCGMPKCQQGSRPDIIVNGHLTDTSEGKTFPVRILGFVDQ